MRGAILSARTISAAFARDWTTRPEVQGVTQCLNRMSDCPRRDVAIARQLLAKGDLVQRMIAGPLAMLARDPFFDPPFRVSRDAARTTMILIDHPAARLAVTLTDGAVVRARGFPERFVIPGRIAVTCVLRSDGAVLHRWRAPPAGPGVAGQDQAPCRRMVPRPIGTGTMLLENGRRTGQILWPGAGDVLTVTLILSAGALPVMREGRVADGRIARTAWIDPAPTHAALQLRLLRALHRSDAAPAFAAATRDAAHQLRWQAMREWLLTGDPAAAARLAEMAATDPHPDVRAAARATLAATLRRAA